MNVNTVCITYIRRFKYCMMAFTLSDKMVQILNIKKPNLNNS